MSNPFAVASTVAREYFTERGENTPEQQATSFIGRIRMDHEGRWRSDTLVDTATEILAAATFDVDDLVENHLHVGLSIEPLNDYDAKAGASVFGVAFPDRREIVICERAERYLPLYRASVAHELAHVLLHGVSPFRGPLNYAPLSARRPPEEREADEFMAALLAPKSVLQLALSLAAHESGLHIRDVLEYANTMKGRWQWRHHILPCLIDRLCLSRHFLLVRMARLGIITNDTIEYHKSYPLPNRWRPSDT